MISFMSNTKTDICPVLLEVRKAFTERNGVWKDTRDFRMLVILCLDLCACYRGLVPL